MNRILKRANGKTYLINVPSYSDCDGGGASVAGSPSGGGPLVSQGPTLPSYMSNIVGWWKGNDTATDEKGSTNLTWVNGPGYSAGTPAYTTGWVGDCFTFTGDASNSPNFPVSQYNPMNGPSPLAVTVMTMEMWIQRADSGAVGQIGSGYATLANWSNYGWGMAILDDGTIDLVNTWGLLPDMYMTGGTVNDTAWHHVAMTIDASNTWSYYLDGALQSSVTPGTPTWGFQGYFSIGTATYWGDQYGYNIDGNSGFWGNIDEVTVYNRNLTVSELSAIYALGRSGKPSL